MPAVLILFTSICMLTLLSMLITISPSASLMHSSNTISSGNRTLLWPGCCRAKKLALRDISKKYILLFCPLTSCYTGGVLQQMELALYSQACQWTQDMELITGSSLQWSVPWELLFVGSLQTMGGIVFTFSVYNYNEEAHFNFNISFIGTCFNFWGYSS